MSDTDLRPDAPLTNSEELNRRIVEAMPCGLVHVSADGSIITANREALRILGWSYDELTKRYTQDFDGATIWDDGSACAAEDYPVTRALRTGQPQPPVTIGVRRPDGEVSWALYTAVPVLAHDQQVCGAVVTFLDVTRQRELDSALRQSEARLRAMVESVPGYALLLDLELNIQFCNRLLPGVALTQVLGQSAVLFVREAERDEFGRRLQEVAETLKPITFESAADPWIGGGTYRLSIGPVKDGPRATGLIMIAEEITHEKELEARLLLSDRLASIGVLAAGVAHEINNPLTYVLGNLELLERQLDRETNDYARVVEIREGSERIANVVSDLMSFSHRDEGKLRAVNVAEVVDRAARVAHHELQRRARFQRGELDVPPVKGSPARLGQVILNMLINAAHSISAGAAMRNEIRVDARVIAQDLVRISISDTGEGIRRELLGRIFDPFITTKPLGEGSGLGLYVCHNIVKALGGAIWVESEVGRGSTFHVDLPIYRAGDEAVPEPSFRSAPRVTDSRRLLVIDDEPSIAAFIRHALSEHEVATASCAHDALAALEARSFDAVLCDVVMPDLTGVQVFEHLKQTRPELSRRFMFLTGAALRDLAPEVIRFGVPVLYKPFTLSDLREAVQRLFSEPD